MGHPRIALVLGGGAARALAHVGVLEVLEGEGVAPAFAVGSSMGGLVAALWATGLASEAIREIARGFRFPAWFVPGGVVAWERVFRTAIPALARATFADLPPVSRWSRLTWSPVAASSSATAPSSRRSARPARSPLSCRPSRSRANGWSTAAS